MEFLFTMDTPNHIWFALNLDSIQNQPAKRLVQLFVFWTSITFLVPSGTSSLKVAKQTQTILNSITLRLCFYMYDDNIYNGSFIIISVGWLLVRCLVGWSVSLSVYQSYIWLVIWSLRPSVCLSVFVSLSEIFSGGSVSIVNVTENGWMDFYKILRIGRTWRMEHLGDVPDYHVETGLFFIVLFWKMNLKIAKQQPLCLGLLTGSGWFQVNRCFEVSDERVGWDRSNDCCIKYKQRYQRDKTSYTTQMKLVRHNRVDRNFNILFWLQMLNNYSFLSHCI